MLAKSLADVAEDTDLFIFLRNPRNPREKKKVKRNQREKNEKYERK